MDPTVTIKHSNNRLPCHWTRPASTQQHLYTHTQHWTQRLKVMMRRNAGWYLLTRMQVRTGSSEFCASLRLPVTPPVCLIVNLMHAHTHHCYTPTPDTFTLDAIHRQPIHQCDSAPWQSSNWSCTMNWPPDTQS